MKPIYIMIALILLFGCKPEQRSDEQQNITFIEDNGLSVPEPSGLDLTFDEGGFWTVSDENSTVYKLNRKGKVKDKFKVEGKDLEGITVIDQLTIAVVLERSGEVVILDTLGNELRRKKIELENDENLGLEGISFDRGNKLFYVVTERKPGLLITLDFDLNEIMRDTLTFAKDYSGIFYDETEKHLWILSDESKLVAKTDLNGNLIHKFDFNIDQAEGVCIDASGEKIYFVSDRKEKLYVYSLNSP